MPNTPPRNEVRSWFEEPVRDGGGDRTRDARSGELGTPDGPTPPEGSPAPGSSPRDGAAEPEAPEAERIEPTERVTDPVRSLGEPERELTGPADLPDRLDGTPPADTVEPQAPEHSAPTVRTPKPATTPPPAHTPTPITPPAAPSAPEASADPLSPGRPASPAEPETPKAPRAPVSSDESATVALPWVAGSGPGTRERPPLEQRRTEEQSVPEERRPADPLVAGTAPVDMLESAHEEQRGRTERQDPTGSEATMPARPFVSPPGAGPAPPSRNPVTGPTQAPGHTPDPSVTQPMATQPARPTTPVPGSARTHPPRHAEPPVDEAVTQTLPVVPASPQFDHRGGTGAGGSDVDTTTEIPRITAAASHQLRDSEESPASPALPDRFRALASRLGELRNLRNPGDLGDDERHRLLVRAGLVAAAVLGVFVLLYSADLVMSHGEVPRGVTVGGVEVGGMQYTAAEQRLREQLEPRLNRPVALRAGDVTTSLDPKAAGLTLDWPSTLEAAGTQPLNPWTRLVSLFTTREVGVVTGGHRENLTAALVGLLPQIDRNPVEGTIRFDGAHPIPVDPHQGQRLDIGKASDAIIAHWADGGVLALPVVTAPVSTTPAGIRATLHDVVEPAVSGPVTVTGEGGNATLEPEAIAASLRFAPDGKGGLTTTVDHPTVVGAVGPALAGTENPGKDAQIVLQGGAPVVLPSTEGRGIDWERSLGPLSDVLRRTGGDRTLPAIYVDRHPKLTTEQVNALGITSQISSFTTKGFAQDSGQNIKRVAEQVNGAIVKPGETFSLNGYTGPRTAASGYVEAGIIDHGRPGRGIGGGISQFATTLYNASYFAGMTDVEHKEHSYYISRYPQAREATVFEGEIDLKFRNDSPTGILIQTSWTPSTITVTFWGTKHVNVESIPGPRTDPTPPPTQVVNEQPCQNTAGEPGFTTTDTRVVRDANTGAEISRHTHTAVYQPEPKVICQPGPPPPPPPGG